MNNSTPMKVRKWADAPYVLSETPKYRRENTETSDPYLETASTMCIVHHAILRGLNSIYLQGPNLLPRDNVNFIGYSLCWYSVIHGHHTSEEEQFFPGIEEAVGEQGLLESNVQQHKSFQEGLELFRSYLEGLAGKESSFDATHLNNIITSFAPPLCEHLSSEIESLLTLSKYENRLPIDDLWKAEGRHTVAAMTKLNALPFFFLNLDITYEDSLWKNWPPVPGSVRWTITQCFTLWHPGY